MWIDSLKRVSMVAAAIAAIGSAGTGVVVGARAAWNTAKESGSAETARDVEVKTLKEETRALKSDVHQLKEGRQEDRARLQRIEDASTTNAETLRDFREEVREGFREMRRRRE